jgi:TBC1 domain family member 14
MLCAWVVSRSDEGLGYVQGIARITAMILLNMAPAPGFIVMKNLLERHCLRSFYGGQSSSDDVRLFLLRTMV